MNVVILLDNFGIGGTELNCTRTLEAMARRNVRATVLHFREDGPLKARIAAAGHRLVHVPIAPLWNPKILLRTAALARAIRAAGATAVHTQDVYTNILGVAAGRYLAGLPVISSRRWKDQVPRPAMTPLNAWAHRHSTLVLPNSPALIETLETEGVRRERIAVHENFIDDAALELLPLDARRAWRQQLGIADDALVIGCVARLSPVKRHDILLEAFAIVARAVPTAALLLVGDGEVRADLEAQRDRLGLQGRVHFAGTLPNAPLPQQLFDVAVLTSGNEGFPNSLVEAAAAAVPMVATRVGGVPDVLFEGETGLGVEVADVAGTASAIQTLLRDEGLRRRLGDRARALVQKRFSESAAVDRLLAIYERVSR